MNQHLHQEHFSDKDGNPAGGATTGKGLSISWQNGPLGRGQSRIEPNGAFVEGVLTAALGRLEYYQSTKFTCRENEMAITKIKEAIIWLEIRTRNRDDRAVEGTHKV